jgi:hypothetical protein
MMLSAIEWAANAGFEFIYLGTCYSKSSLYKTRYPGIEFYNGSKWSKNLCELRYLIDRQDKQVEVHVFEDDEYLRKFCKGSFDGVTIGDQT